MKENIDKTQLKERYQICNFIEKLSKQFGPYETYVIDN